MSYEISTIYAGPDRATFTEDLNTQARPMITDAGAKEVTGWQAFTGPMTGLAAITSRWESLDDVGAWMADMAQRSAAGGDLADLVSRYQLVTRVVGRDLAEAGTPAGSVLAATRFSFGATPVGLDRAAELGVESGANGVRILAIIMGGEMTGQVIGGTFYDSMDTMASAIETISGNPEFVANAQAGEAKLESRTIFQRV